MTNSPWSNVPKMTRKEAAEWKLDPRNRREATKKKMFRVTHMAKFKTPNGKIKRMVVKNEKDMMKMLESLFVGELK